MTIRALIVDDEALAREKLRTLLAREPDVKIVGECRDGAEAVAAIPHQAPDLVFLDVQMPEVDGFAVVEALDPARIPALVFVTAYDKYALRAFEVHALDYLLKPFDRARFQKTLARARAELARGPGGTALAPRLEALLAGLRAARPYAQRLVVREGGRVFFLRVAELDWIESAGNYARLHAAGDQHLVRETMKALESRLDPDRFVRIHRSAIVNLDRIATLKPGFHGEYVVTLRNGHELASSRAYGERLHELLRGGP